jgi:putative nucleotidyltransferase with HDIG domain
VDILGGAIWLVTWSFITNEYVGKVLANDLFSKNGVLLLPKGTCLTKEHIALLKKHSVSPKIEQNTPTTLEVPNEAINQFGSKMLDKEYKQALRYSKSIFNDLNSLSDFTENELFDPFIPLLGQVFKEEDAIFYMHSIKNFDEYTYRHSLNVGLIASLIGKAMDLSHDETILLGKMGFLHDIGKMKVSEGILNKPDRLSDQEFEEIKKHTVYGYEILKQTKNINSNILAGTLHHHERLNGTGYPSHIKQDSISFYVQILSVADVYDAISSNRVYQEGRNLFKTIKLLLEEVEQDRLNKQIVYSFVRFLMQKNIGKQVYLNNGEIGKIIYVPHEEPHKPILMIENKPIDLRKVQSVQIIDIIKAKHPA